MDVGDHSTSEKKAGWQKSLKNRVGNVAKYGWKRGHAMNVANRLHFNVTGNTATAKARQEHMSERQKLSAKKAEKYWNARAKGQKTPKRGLIQRLEDSHRSFTLEERIAKQAASVAVNVASDTIKAKRLDADYNPLVSAGKQAAGRAIAMASSEALDRLFGHF